VLIIEDDPDIAEGLRYNLEREGLEARVAETGEQGLQAALDKKNPPALILLDLMLPGMTGTELCRRLRREPQTRRTPIIMRTPRGASSRDTTSSTTSGATITTATRARSTFTYAASGRSSARAPTQSRPWSASATASPAAPHTRAAARRKSNS